MSELTPMPADASRPGLFARWSATFPGPVFMREINASGRRTWTYITRGLFMLGLAGIMGLVFLTHLPALHASVSGLAQVQELQGLAPTATASLVWFLFVTLSLAAASQCGGAICDERRKGSLASLLTTPLAAWEIIMGKLLAGLAEILLLGLASLPLLLAVRIFGGLTAETVFASFGVMIPSIILTASLTILASVGARHSSTAMLTGLGATIVLWIGPPLLALIGSTSVGTRVASLWFEFVPLWVLGRVTTELIFGQSFGVPASFPWYASSLASLAASAAALLLATMLLRRTLAREASGATPVAAKAASSAQAFTSRAVGDRPVLWRELQIQRGRRWWRILRWPVMLTLIAALWSTAINFSSDDIFYPVAIVGTIISLVVAATSTTGAISTERESRTLDSLLATPLTPAEIVTGKFFGALRHMWFWPSVILIHYLVMGVLFQGRDAWALLLYPLALVPPMAALCASGILFSGLIRKTSTATTVNLCLGVAAWLGVPILGAILGQALRSYLDASTVMTPLLLPNPVMHMFTTTEACMRDRATIDLLGLTQLAWSGYVAALCLYALGYAAVTWGLLATAWSSRVWTNASPR